MTKIDNSTKLSEESKKKLKELIIRIKEKKEITIDLLKEFKTLDISKQKPIYFVEDILTRPCQAKELE